MKWNVVKQFILTSLAFGGAFASSKTCCGAVSSVINGSFCERWTKWNVTAFFLSINFRFVFGWKCKHICWIKTDGRRILWLWLPFIENTGKTHNFLKGYLIESSQELTIFATIERVNRLNELQLNGVTTQNIMYFFETKWSKHVSQLTTTIEALSLFVSCSYTQHMGIYIHMSNDKKAFRPMLMVYSNRLTMLNLLNLEP